MESPVSLQRNSAGEKIPVPARRPLPLDDTPTWTKLPYDTKCPLSKIPKDMILSREDLGHTLYHTFPFKDFDLSLSTPFLDTTGYNPLHDPHLRNFFRSHSRYKALVRKGLITEDGKVRAGLREYNQYRMYLYHLWVLQVNQLKELQLAEEKKRIESLIEAHECGDSLFREIVLKHDKIKVEDILDEIASKLFETGEEVKECDTSPVVQSLIRWRQYQEKLRKNFKQSYPEVKRWLSDQSKHYKQLMEKQLNDRASRDKKLRTRWEKIYTSSLSRLNRETGLREQEEKRRVLSEQRQSKSKTLWSRIDKEIQSKRIKRLKPSPKPSSADSPFARKCPSASPRASTDVEPQLTKSGHPKQTNENDKIIKIRNKTLSTQFFSLQKPTVSGSVSSENSGKIQADAAHKAIKSESKVLRCFYPYEKRQCSEDNRLEQSSPISFKSDPEQIKHMEAELSNITSSQVINLSDRNVEHTVKIFKEIEKKQANYFHKFSKIKSCSDLDKMFLISRGTNNGEKEVIYKDKKESKQPGLKAVSCSVIADNQHQLLNYLYGLPGMTKYKRISDVPSEQEEDVTLKDRMKTKNIVSKNQREKEKTDKTNAVIQNIPQERTQDIWEIFHISLTAKKRQQHKLFGLDNDELIIRRNDKIQKEILEFHSELSPLHRVISNRNLKSPDNHRIKLKEIIYQLTPLDHEAEDYLEMKSNENYYKKKVFSNIVLKDLLKDHDKGFINEGQLLNQASTRDCNTKMHDFQKPVSIRCDRNQMQSAHVTYKNDILGTLKKHFDENSDEAAQITSNEAILTDMDRSEFEFKNIKYKSNPLITEMQKQNMLQSFDTEGKPLTEFQEHSKVDLYTDKKILEAEDENLFYARKILLKKTVNLKKKHSATANKEHDVNMTTPPDIELCDVIIGKEILKQQIEDQSDNKTGRKRIHTIEKLKESNNEYEASGKIAEKRNLNKMLDIEIYDPYLAKEVSKNPSGKKRRGIETTALRNDRKDSGSLELEPSCIKYKSNSSLHDLDSEQETLEKIIKKREELTNVSTLNKINIIKSENQSPETLEYTEQEKVFIENSRLMSFVPTNKDKTLHVNTDLRYENNYLHNIESSLLENKFENSAHETKQGQENSCLQKTNNGSDKTKHTDAVKESKVTLTEQPLIEDQYLDYKVLIKECNKQTAFKQTRKYFEKWLDEIHRKYTQARGKKPEESIQNKLSLLDENFSDRMESIEKIRLKESIEMLENVQKKETVLEQEQKEHHKYEIYMPETNKENSLATKKYIQVEELNTDASDMVYEKESITNVRGSENEVTTHSIAKHKETLPGKNSIFIKLDESTNENINSKLNSNSKAFKGVSTLWNDLDHLKFRNESYRLYILSESEENTRVNSMRSVSDALKEYEASTMNRQLVDSNDNIRKRESELEENELIIDLNMLYTQIQMSGESQDSTLGNTVKIKPKLKYAQEKSNIVTKEEESEYENEFKNEKKCHNEIANLYDAEHKSNSMETLINEEIIGNSNNFVSFIADSQDKLKDENSDKIKESAMCCMNANSQHTHSTSENTSIDSTQQTNYATHRINESLTNMQEIVTRDQTDFLFGAINHFNKVNGHYWFNLDAKFHTQKQTASLNGNKKELSGKDDINDFPNINSLDILNTSKKVLFCDPRSTPGNYQYMVQNVDEVKKETFVTELPDVGTQHITSTDKNSDINKMSLIQQKNQESLITLSNQFILSLTSTVEFANLNPKERRSHLTLNLGYIISKSLFEDKQNFYDFLKVMKHNIYIFILKTTPLNRSQTQNIKQSTKFIAKINLQHQVQDFSIENFVLCQVKSQENTNISLKKVIANITNEPNIENEAHEMNMESVALIPFSSDNYRSLSIQSLNSENFLLHGQSLSQQNISNEPHKLLKKHNSENIFIIETTEVLKDSLNKPLKDQFSQISQNKCEAKETTSQPVNATQINDNMFIEKTDMTSKRLGKALTYGSRPELLPQLILFDDDEFNQHLTKNFKTEENILDSTLESVDNIKQTPVKEKEIKFEPNESNEMETKVDNMEDSLGNTLTHKNYVKKNKSFRKVCNLFKKPCNDKQLMHLLKIKDTVITQDITDSSLFSSNCGSCPQHSNEQNEKHTKSLTDENVEGSTDVKIESLEENENITELKYAYELNNSGSSQYILKARINNAKIMELIKPYLEEPQQIQNTRH